MARRDLYAVKEHGNGLNAWCIVHICRSLATAKRLLGTCQPILGYSHKAKLVHPAQNSVDLYVLAGNTIHD
jgi:hypothetical protein|tara:strand:- start:2004 stop:2216 length:213 start_codon:yes stop_codon:yes gene_type:complete